MSELADFQGAFLAQLFAADEPAGGAAIYRRNVMAALVEALGRAYPAVRRLVGEAFFDEAARRHARATPSRCGDLNAYGEGFAEFLEGYAPAAPLACLPDVARLEWAVHACFHAEDAPALEARVLVAAAAAPEDLRLALHPAVRLVASPHPVAAIHAANVAGDGIPARTAGSDHLLVRRESGEVRVEALAAREWRFLARLAQGEPLGTACDAFGAEGLHALAPALARHARAGLFAATPPAGSR